MEHWCTGPCTCQCQYLISQAENEADVTRTPGHASVMFTDVRSAGEIEVTKTLVHGHGSVMLAADVKG